MSTILDLVREFRKDGGFYDDDQLRFVADRLGCEPSHDLSRACYEAKGQLSDEAAQAKIDVFIADGFIFARDANIEPGKRCEVMRATKYVGRNVPDYSAVVSCRTITGADERIAFLPGRSRTRGFYLSDSDLVRAM